MKGSVVVSLLTLCLVAFCFYGRVDSDCVINKVEIYNGLLSLVAMFALIILQNILSFFYLLLITERN